LCGCPQLLSDEFSVLGSSPDPGADGGALPDGGNGTAGSGGDTNGAAGTSGLGGTGGLGGTASILPTNTTPDAGGAGGGSVVTVSGAPTIVDVSPSDGATGVPAAAVVTLTFSKPMNTIAVQAAYGSSDLPPSAVTFSWSAGNTVLQIAPNQPLTLAAGTSPAATTAKHYAFEIGTGAVDESGDPLPPFSSGFSTLRAVTQTLGAVQDRSLTGNWRSDDVYGDNSCTQSGSTTTCIGDSSNSNSTYRGFVTFDLSALPAQTEGFSTAQLGMSVDNMRGSPFADLGSLVVEHVSFGSISLDAFNSAALSSAISLSSSATLGVGAQLDFDVLSPATADLPSLGRSQFRFRFTTATNSDASGDLIEVLWATESLTVTCLIP
jgi:hypothetical protein